MILMWYYLINMFYKFKYVFYPVVNPGDPGYPAMSFVFFVFFEYFVFNPIVYTNIQASLILHPCFLSLAK
jgi:hypothetical protein